jgi:EpsI family protein
MSGGALEVNQLTAVIPERTEHILYWTRVGDSMPISWAEQRLTIALDNLKGRIPDAVLVRVSTIDADDASAFNRLADFIEKLLTAMPRGTHRVLVSGITS